MLLKNFDSCLYQGYFFFLGLIFLIRKKTSIRENTKVMGSTSPCLFSRIKLVHTEKLFIISSFFKYSVWLIENLHTLSSRDPAYAVCPLFIPTNFPHKKVTAANFKATTKHIDHDLMMVAVTWHKAKSLWSWKENGGKLFMRLHELSMEEQFLLYGLVE